MAEKWPDTLNYILDRGSYSIEPHSDLARTEFDDGPQLVRVRFSSPTTIYNGTITLTNYEYLIFRSFYINILNQGSKWFDFPIWDGLDYVTHRARFSEKFQIKDEGYDQNTLTIKLEIRNYITYDVFASYILGLYGTEFVINEIADPLQKIVNIDYPKVMEYY